MHWFDAAVQEFDAPVQEFEPSLHELSYASLRSRRFLKTLDCAWKQDPRAARLWFTSVIAHPSQLADYQSRIASLKLDSVARENISRAFPGLIDKIRRHFHQVEDQQLTWIAANVHSMTDVAHAILVSNPEELAPEWKDAIYVAPMTMLPGVAALIQEDGKEVRNLCRRNIQHHASRIAEAMGAPFWWNYMIDRGKQLRSVCTHGTNSREMELLWNDRSISTSVAKTGIAYFAANVKDRRRHPLYRQAIKETVSELTVSYVHPTTNECLGIFNLESPIRRDDWKEQVAFVEAGAAKMVGQAMTLNALARSSFYIWNPDRFGYNLGELVTRYCNAACEDLEHDRVEVSLWYLDDDLQEIRLCGTSGYGHDALRDDYLDPGSYLGEVLKLGHPGSIQVVNPLNEAAYRKGEKAKQLLIKRLVSVELTPVPYGQDRRLRTILTLHTQLTESDPDFPTRRRVQELAEVMRRLIDGYARYCTLLAVADMAAIIAEQAHKRTDPARIIELIRRGFVRILALDAAYIIPKSHAVPSLGPIVAPWVNMDCEGPHGINLWSDQNPGGIVRRNAADRRPLEGASFGEHDWAKNPDHVRTLALAVRDMLGQPLAEFIFCRSEDRPPFTPLDAVLVRDASSICVPVLEAWVGRRPQSEPMLPRAAQPRTPDMSDYYKCVVDSRWDYTGLKLETHP